MAVSLYERVAQNPFYVLELPTSASRADVERAGQKLLALLGIESASARRYWTPVGELERDADLVRRSLGRLREPGDRVLWELWVRERGASAPATAAAGFEPALSVWSESPWLRT